MKETIGNIVINYDFYGGEELYNDGDEIENYLLNVCREGKIKETLFIEDKWPVLYHLSDIRENLIDWYPFKANETVLEIGSGCGAVTGILAKKLRKVTCIELSKRRSLINAYRNKELNNVEIMVGNFSDIQIEEKFDYVTLIGVFEYSGSYIKGDNPYLEMLRKVKSFLKKDGRIIIAIENKMGMKYLNGAKEDHVSRAFAGIEDYRYINGVRTFSKPELCEMFETCGILDYKFYYPVPDYKLPDTIYSDEILPGKGDIRTWGRNYDNIRIGLYNEAIMADQICKDKEFDYMSNSFLVVCNEKDNSVVYAHYTKTRKEEFQTSTQIHKDGKKLIVRKNYDKKAVRPYDILHTMASQYSLLQREFAAIKFLEPKIVDGVLEYDFINAILMDRYIVENSYPSNTLVDRLRSAISTYMKPNEDYLTDFVVTDKYRNIFGDNAVGSCEKSLAVTNLDMTWSNLLLHNGEAICIDYEWIFDFPIPYEYVLYRGVEALYSKYGMYFSKYINLKELLLEVGIKSINIPIYKEMQNRFYEYVHGENQKYQYLKRYVKPSGMMQLPI